MRIRPPGVGRLVETVGRVAGQVRLDGVPIQAKLTALVIALAGLVWGGYMWGRDLSLFRVRDVEITGLESRESPAIRRALRQTAVRMTTLNLHEDELERAVDSFPVVRSISTEADFPRKLRIRVNEFVPIAALDAPGGRRIAVSSAFTLLRSVGQDVKLPIVKVGSIPTSGTLVDEEARHLVRALAGAPAALRPLIERAFLTRDGIEVPLREGPRLELGSGARLRAKWAAVARVLADPASRGAELIDLRVPERPAAGGFEPGDGSTGGPAANPQL